MKTRMLKLSLLIFMLVSMVIPWQTVFAAPGVWNDIEGAYYGNVRIPVYYLDNVYSQRIRFVNIAIWNQADSLIVPTEPPAPPSPGATVYLYEYATDIEPIIEIDCIGMVGDDNRARITLAGVDAVTGDSVMINARIYLNRAGTVVVSMKGYIIGGFPSVDPLNNASYQGSFKVLWHPFI